MFRRSVYSGPCEVTGRCDDERWTPPLPGRPPPPGSMHVRFQTRENKLGQHTQWICMTTQERHAG
jgi:hypothetical protein